MTRSPTGAGPRRARMAPAGYGSRINCATWCRCAPSRRGPRCGCTCIATARAKNRPAYTRLNWAYPMAEAVIVAYGRSPIGRAGKGSLIEVRPDDLAAHVTSKVLQKVPQLDRSTIDDLMCGCGLPAGEQGFNLGRVVSILTRLDVPGTTVNRYRSEEHTSELQSRLHLVCRLLLEKKKKK